MIVVQDTVPLKKVSGNENSIRIPCKPGIVKTLSLQNKDSVQLNFLGLFNGPTQKEPIPLNIPMVGRTAKTGSKSLGITIKKNIVARYNLEEDYGMVVNMQKISQIMPVQDTVQLKSVGRNEKSIKFLCTPAITKPLSLRLKESVQITFLGLFNEPTQWEPIPLDIPMIGTTAKAGSNSLGITIKRNIAMRYNLENDYDMIVNIEKLVQSTI